MTIVDESHDGITGGQFCHKTVDYNFVIYVSYLRPERSNRGRAAQSFFSHILSEIYMNKMMPVLLLVT